MLRRADLTDGFSWHAVGSWWVCLTEEEVAVPAMAAGVGSRVGLAEVGVKAAKLASAAGKKRAGWNKGRKKEPAAEADLGGGEALVGVKATQADSGTTLRKVGNFREVACTFEDVAWSKDLTDKDRGQLGEFLRFVMRHNDPTDQKYTQIFEGILPYLDKFLLAKTNRIIARKPSNTFSDLPLNNLPNTPIYHYLHLLTNPPLAYTL